MKAPEHVLDQLSYLIDEIETQLPFLSAIPPVQLEGVPYEGERSIRDCYHEMLEREWSQNLAALGESGGPELPVADVPGIARELIRARQKLVDRLSRVSDWEQPLDSGDVMMVDFAHGIALADAESLRAIALRFHEGNFRFSRPQ